MMLAAALLWLLLWCVCGGSGSGRRGVVMVHGTYMGRFCCGGYNGDDGIWRCSRGCGGGGTWSWLGWCYTVK